MKIIMWIAITINAFLTCLFGFLDYCISVSQQTTGYRIIIAISAFNAVVLLLGLIKIEDIETKMKRRKTNG